MRTGPRPSGASSVSSTSHASSIGSGSRSHGCDAGAFIGDNSADVVMYDGDVEVKGAALKNGLLHIDLGR